jgi:hypothetical protein
MTCGGPRLRRGRVHGVSWDWASARVATVGCGCAGMLLRESLAVPLTCRSGGKGLTSARRMAGSSRLRVIAIQASPRGPRAACIVVYLLSAALTGCSACVSGPQRTSQRASSAVGGARCGLGWDEWWV